MIQRGDIIDGKYEILKLRGREGMSKVWLATDTRLNKQWAVKEIDKSSKEYKDTVNEEKTLKEYELMKKLDHPSFPRIVDVIDSPATLCIVMDWIDGDSLHEILRDLSKENRTLEQDTVVSWMLDICDALGYLHSLDPPVIYRDMKPANVMLTRDHRIKIIDFGIAREYKSGMEDTQPLGTRGYASPEHFSQHTDVRSDVYTVGTTLYQLLTGKDPSKPPFYLKPIREFNPDLSSGLEKIIIKATDQDPDKRYQNMEELANALESYKSLEQEYIDDLEYEEYSLRRKLTAGTVMTILGIVLVAASIFITGRTYNALIGTTPGTPQAKENYIKAIELEPSRKEGYEKLLTEYTGNGSFTDAELAEFMNVYEAGKEDLSRKKKDYSELNYEIGEGILTYYEGKTDASSRAKLLQAEPFFAEVAEDDERHNIAGNYVFLAEYYRNYVLADSSLVVKGATTEDYEALISNCVEAIKSLQSEEFAGREKMKAITYEYILTLLSNEASSMKKTGVQRNSLDAIPDMVAGDPECTPENAELAKQCRKSIDLSYSAKKEGGKGTMVDQKGPDE